MREFILSAMRRANRMNEEQLRSLLYSFGEEYSLFVAMMESLDDGLILLDKNNFIVKANRAAERILGTRLTDIQEIKLWDCIDCQKISEFIQRVIKNEETKKNETFVLNSTSLDIKYVEVSILPLVFEKKIIGTIVVLKDVTKEKHSEIKRRRLESLASLTNAAASIAHEIKNPLGAMSIHMQLLAKKLNTLQLQDEMHEKVFKHIDVINEELENLNKTVVDFLFAVRPIKFAFDNIDVNGLLKNIIQLYEPELTKVHIETFVSTDESLTNIWGDERFLRQAFTNVITNAKHAMPEGGKLFVSTYEKDNFVFIKFEDTGIGISEENLHKIFEPYFTTKATGTGLGLPLAYKVIKEHGGDIFVNSKKGEGTAFIFSLPILRNNERLLLEPPDAKSAD